MPSLDDLIRDKAKAGQLNHLSLIASTTREGTKFKVIYRDTKSDGHTFAQDADPVAALVEALTTRKHIVGVGSNAKKPSGDAVEEVRGPSVRKRKSRSQT